MSSHPIARALLMDHPAFPLPGWRMAEPRVHADSGLFPDLGETRKISSCSLEHRRIMAAQAVAAITLAGEFDLWPTRHAILSARAFYSGESPQVVFGAFPVDLATFFRRLGGFGELGEGVRNTALDAVSRMTGVPRREFQHSRGHGFFLEGSLGALLEPLGETLDRRMGRNLWAYRWDALPCPEPGEIAYWSAVPKLARRLGGAMWADVYQRGWSCALLQPHEFLKTPPKVDLLILVGELDEFLLEQAEAEIDHSCSALALIGSFPPGWSPPAPLVEEPSSLSMSLALTGVGLDRGRRELRNWQGRFDPRLDADRKALTESARRYFEASRAIRRSGRPVDPVHRLLSLCSEGLPEEFLLGFEDVSAGLLATRAADGRIVRDIHGVWRLPRPPRLRPDPLHLEVGALFDSEDPRALLYAALGEVAVEGDVSGGACEALKQLLQWLRSSLDALEERRVMDLTASLVPSVLGPQCDRLRLEAALSLLDLALARELLGVLPPDEGLLWQAWLDLEDRDSPGVLLDDIPRSLSCCPRVLAECAIHDLRSPDSPIIGDPTPAAEILEAALAKIKGKLRKRFEVLRVAATRPEDLFDESWATPLALVSRELEKLILHKRALAHSRKEEWPQAQRLLDDLIAGENRPGPLGILFLDLASVLPGKPGEMSCLLRSLRLLESAGFRRRTRLVLFNIAMHEIETLRLENAASRLDLLEGAEDGKYTAARAELALARGALEEFFEEVGTLGASAAGSEACFCLEGVVSLLEGRFARADESLNRGGEDAEPWLAVLRALQGREFSTEFEWDPWRIGRLARLLSRLRSEGRIEVNAGELGNSPFDLLGLALADHLLRDPSWITTELRSRLVVALDSAGMGGWARSIELQGEGRLESYLRAVGRVLENASFAVLSSDEIGSILSTLQIGGLVVVRSAGGEEVLRWGEGDVEAQMGRGALVVQILGAKLRPTAAWKLLLGLLDTLFSGGGLCEGIARPVAQVGILGKSAVIEELRQSIARVAPSSLAVLLQGETGVGKDLVAQAIHQLSQRQGPFITVNVAAVADTLFESELYGVLRGAYTGADRDRAGLVEEADGGTLFLDEIGDLVLGNQVKLLRFLESGEVRRVGAGKPKKVDVRVLAATHRDLEKMVEEGSFREDLYYRIVSARVEIPPLRDRGEDILLLKEYFAQRAVREAGLQRARWSSEADGALMHHRWKGNVRELRRSVEHALLVAEGGVIRAEHLPFETGGKARPLRRWEEAHHQLKVELIEAAMEASGGNQAAAARSLGLSRQTLLYHIRKLGLG